MLTDCLFCRDSPVLPDCLPLTNTITLDCKVVLLPILIGCSDEVGQSSLGPPAPFDFGGRVAKKGCSLIHLLSHSHARPLWPNTHEPIWHWERKHFPFLTPITHEVLIPYDGCQSPAVYISSILPHPLIFLSSLPCDYNSTFILFLRSIEIKWLWPQWWTHRCICGGMDGCRGCILMEQQHDITALPWVEDLC